MKQTYHSILDESTLTLTNFNCQPSQQLLLRSDLYKIIWCQQHPKELVVDGYQVRLEKHQLLFCTPLNNIKIDEDEGLLAVVFNREFYCIRDHDAEVSCNGLLFFGSSRPVIIELDERQQAVYTSMFHLLEEEFQINDHIQGEMLRVLLKRILISSSRLITNAQENGAAQKGQGELLRQFHILVEQHFKKAHDVTFYANHLYKSPKTLSNVFKKVGSASPLTLINQRIMLEAKRLLLYSDLSVEEIAYKLGYTDAAHFSKFFKRHAHQTSSQFKSDKTEHKKKP